MKNGMRMKKLRNEVDLLQCDPKMPYFNPKLAKGYYLKYYYTFLFFKM